MRARRQRPVVEHGDLPPQRVVDPTRTACAAGTESAIRAASRNGCGAGAESVRAAGASGAASEEAADAAGGAASQPVASHAPSSARTARAPAAFVIGNDALVTEPSGKAPAWTV